MTDSLRRVAIIGGSRIPFCRSNSIYATRSNMDMLSAALQGVTDRFGLDGVQLDEVVAGAVTTHSRDWNLAREAVLSTTLSPLTPGITLQQACGTSLQAALGIAAKIAAGQIECGIAAGTDTTSDPPIVFGPKFSRRLVQLGRARSFGDKLKVFKGFSPAELAPVPPANGEPRTRMSMGQHCERMAREWGIRREDQDELAATSHLNAAKAWNEGFFDPLVTPWGGAARDNNVRPDTSAEKLAGLKTVFAKDDAATLTAGNSTPLTDGAAGVLLASEEWARERNLPVQAWLVTGRSAAVDFVNDEGLLMAPTVAVAELLQRTGLSLQDFDYYEIHEAFAAQVLCTLKAWESEDYCRNRLGLDEPLGPIDRSKMNVKGSSVAVGHPFAATGARILGTLSQLMDNEGGGRGLISVCTAGGMGVAAIVERE
ncbi:acetyl-CoA C-acetyltransferase [Marinihelvus fidelis]|uniref:Acetyl-CoA C-acetyltransferase n=1 Tax=Marinihelvus fidelis TaxID=2613842 RepID=A0A5N0TB99_9GAMM|nr:acetyl-CoA C-acetyltransferase [Marinihelvus fidelis]KAA9132021.1 acetyl-CoA C-acetyltransferase [Marinihelvus fidelis]